VWTVEGFGSGKSSAANAAIHFGDTKAALETETPATDATTKNNGSKPAGKLPAKNIAKAGAASRVTRRVKR
jgi:hypothetical protein